MLPIAYPHRDFILDGVKNEFSIVDTQALLFQQKHRIIPLQHAP